MEQQSDVNTKPADSHVYDVSPHDSDDELVVHTRRRDPNWARQERERRIAEGADPNSIILQTELRDHIPRREDESDTEYAKRFSETMNAMIRRGVVILSDMLTADVLPSSFGLSNGRRFDLGPGTGVTKGEFRAFNKWFAETSTSDVPQKWLKYEKLPSQGVKSRP